MHNFNDLQSVAALKEFDFLEEQELVPRMGPLLIPSVPSTPLVAPEQLVPPSPQPVIEFPDDEVLVALYIFIQFILLFARFPSMFLFLHHQLYSALLSPFF